MGYLSFQEGTVTHLLRFFFPKNPAPKNRLIFKHHRHPRFQRLPPIRHPNRPGDTPFSGYGKTSIQAIQPAKVRRVGRWKMAPPFHYHRRFRLEPVSTLRNQKSLGVQKKILKKKDHSWNLKFGERINEKQRLVGERN